MVRMGKCNFPNLDSFIIYLKQNLPKIKKHRFLIVNNPAILNLELGGVIKLLLDNKIDVYGDKDTMLGRGNVKYISISLRKL